MPSAPSAPRRPARGWPSRPAAPPTAPRPSRWPWPRPPDVVVAPFDLPLIDGAKLADILRANPRTQHGALRLPGPARAGRGRAGARRRHRAGRPGSRARWRAGSRPWCRGSRAWTRWVRSRTTPRVEGKLSKIGLADLLQLFNQNGKTGSLELSRRDVWSGREENGDDPPGPGQHRAGQRPVTWWARRRSSGCWPGTTGPSPSRRAASTWCPAIQKPTARAADGGHAPARRGQPGGRLAAATRLGHVRPAVEERRPARTWCTRSPRRCCCCSRSTPGCRRSWTAARSRTTRCCAPSRPWRSGAWSRCGVPRGPQPAARHRRPGPVRAGPGAAPARLARGGASARYAACADAKLLLLSAGPGATADFVRLLRGLEGVRLEGVFAGGTFGADDLAAGGPRSRGRGPRHPAAARAPRPAATRRSGRSRPTAPWNALLLLEGPGRGEASACTWRRPSAPAKRARGRGSST